MSIPIVCGQCSQNYNVADAMAGRRVKCKKCGGTITVPGVSSPASSSSGRSPADQAAGLSGLLDEFDQQPAYNPLQGAPQVAPQYPAAPAHRQSKAATGSPNVLLRIAIGVGSAFAFLLLLSCAGLLWYMTGIDRKEIVGTWFVDAEATRKAFPGSVAAGPQFRHAVITFDRDGTFHYRSLMRGGPHLLGSWQAGHSSVTAQADGNMYRFDYKNGQLTERVRGKDGVVFAKPGHGSRPDLLADRAAPDVGSPSGRTSTPGTSPTAASRPPPKRAGTFAPWHSPEMDDGGCTISTITNAVFSADATRLVVDGFRAIQCWDLQAGRPLGGPSGQGSPVSIQALTISQDGRITVFVTLTPEKQLIAWDVDAARELARVNTQTEAVAITPDGRYATTSGPQTRTLWRLPELSAKN